MEKCNVVSDGKERNMHFHLTTNAEKKDVRCIYSRVDYSMKTSVLIFNNITTTERYFLKLVTHSQVCKCYSISVCDLNVVQEQGFFCGLLHNSHVKHGRYVLSSAREVISIPFQTKNYVSFYKQKMQFMTVQ
jgi:hypothetical protein